MRSMQLLYWASGTLGSRSRRLSGVVATSGACRWWVNSCNHACNHAWEHSTECSPSVIRPPSSTRPSIGATQYLARQPPLPQRTSA